MKRPASCTRTACSAAHTEALQARIKQLEAELDETRVKLIHEKGCRIEALAQLDYERKEATKLLGQRLQKLCFSAWRLLDEEERDEQEMSSQNI